MIAAMTLVCLVLAAGFAFMIGISEDIRNELRDIHKILKDKK